MASQGIDDCICGNLPFFCANLWLYDPVSGQFTQQDPIGISGGLNVYGFVGGDPANFSDPFGLCPPKDTDVSTCGSGNLGDAWRALDAAGGVGKALISNIVADGLKVNEAAWSGRNNCGTVSCIQGTTITLNNTKAPGALAAAIAHEYGHSTETFMPTEIGAGVNELRAWFATLDMAQKLQPSSSREAFSEFATTFGVIQSSPQARMAAIKQWGCNAALKAGLPCTP